MKFDTRFLMVAMLVCGLAGCGSDSSKKGAAGEKAGAPVRDLQLIIMARALFLAMAALRSTRRISSFRMENSTVSARVTSPLRKGPDASILAPLLDLAPRSCRSW